jgi:thiosulfate dehydrogenase
MTGRGLAHALAPALATAALAACSSTSPSPATGAAADQGRMLFSDTELSTSSTNTFSCATCHDADSSSEVRKPGGALAGVTERPTFWAGQENDLLRAINDCRYYFMGIPRAWTADDLEARAMFAFLASLPATYPAARPFTIDPTTPDLHPRDAAAGALLFPKTCGVCHGEVHTGKGRLGPQIPAIPDETLSSHAGVYSDDEQRLVFVEKSRHGGFFGYGGNMPPFSREILSDENLTDLLAHMGVGR